MNGNTEYGLQGNGENQNTCKDLKTKGEIGFTSELVCRCYDLKQQSFNLLT